jgi:hypothetical protein
MLIIGAMVTIASFGLTEPTAITISFACLAVEAAELIMGKNMRELLTNR